MASGRLRVFGIYGYGFHIPADICGLELVPMCEPAEADMRGRHPSLFKLTGFGRIVSPSSDEWQDMARLHVLEAGMTFAEQRQVIVTRPILISDGDSEADIFSEKRMGAQIQAEPERHSHGAAIASELWAKTSRSAFLRLLLHRFEHETPNDVLRLAFFRQVEIWRLRTPFVELQHFLAFSGLEMLARASGAYERQNNAAVPISEFVNKLGFGVSQKEVERWTEARNNAFHRGLLSAPARDGTGELRLTDQLYPLTLLVADATLKTLGFDDGRINWNRWRDRMHFC